MADRLVAFSFNDAQLQNSSHRILFGPLKGSSRARATNSCAIYTLFFHSLIQLLVHCSADLNAVCHCSAACRMRNGEERNAQTTVSRHTIGKGIIFVCTKRSRARVATFFPLCCSKLEIFNKGDASENQSRDMWCARKNTYDRKK